MEVGNGWRGDSEERGKEVNGGDRVEEGWRRGKESRWRREMKVRGKRAGGRGEIFDGKGRRR